MHYRRSMASTATAYLTGFGRYLPGEPVDNDGIVSRLGGDDAVTERIRRRVLEANGIRQRHYALDETGHPTELNEELAVKALRAALDDRGLAAADLRMLACATTMGDVLVPGFASMVQGAAGEGAAHRGAFLAEVDGLREELARSAEFRPGRVVAAAHAAIRAEIPFLDRDRALDGEVAAAVRLVEEGALLAAIPRSGAAA